MYSVCTDEDKVLMIKNFVAIQKDAKNWGLGPKGCIKYGNALKRTLNRGFMQIIRWSVVISHFGKLSSVIRLVNLFRCSWAESRLGV
jgi:hypothetical protein